MDLMKLSVRKKPSFPPRHDFMFTLKEKLIISSDLKTVYK